MVIQVDIWIQAFERNPVIYFQVKVQFPEYFLNKCDQQKVNKYIKLKNKKYS